MGRTPGLPGPSGKPSACHAPRQDSQPPISPHDPPTFFDSKQHLGLHDPQVWNERSVERAHPMAWFVGSLVVLWYCVAGHEGSHVERERPWYKEKVTPTFTDMLAALRLQLWEQEVFGESAVEVAFARMHLEFRRADRGLPTGRFED